MLNFCAAPSCAIADCKKHVRLLHQWLEQYPPLTATIHMPLPREWRRVKMERE
jgi:hypothetical protein